jgi:TetR/AcrR family transcriptional repressor of nem operon
MASKGESTRERILEAAEALVFERGFSGTAIDDILSKTNLTKGAFFYHFKDKADLASAILERYWDQDFAILDGLSKRADALADTPAQAVILFLKLFEEFLQGLATPLPGCLFASYVYESGAFEPAISRYIRNGFRQWSKMFEEKLDAALRETREKPDVSAKDLAEMAVCLIEGAHVLARANVACCASSSPSCCRRGRAHAREAQNETPLAEAIAGFPDVGGLIAQPVRNGFYRWASIRPVYVTSSCFRAA